MKRTQLAKKVKGTMSQYEDWWYLVEEDDGTRKVIHEWDHVQLRGLDANRGEASYTVEEFLSGDHYRNAQSALEEILKGGDRVGNG